MIQFTPSFKQKVSNIKERIIVNLIKSKAYQGYCYYCSIDENKDSHTGKSVKSFTFDEFTKFESWKIRFSYLIYIERVLKIKVKKSAFDFPYQSNKNILIWWIKSLFR